jgi:pyrroloquinoline quinone biosynthesis protein D
MTTPAGELVPTFAAGVQFRFDAVRKAWVILAPERVFMPEETAVDVLKLVDGRRTIQTLVAELCKQYDAQPTEIMSDVTDMLRELQTKGVVRL